MTPTKISNCLTEKDLIERKIIMMIQPVENEMMRMFFELAMKTNTKWMIDEKNDIMIVLKKNDYFLCVFKKYIKKSHIILSNNVRY